jgi:dimethylaniline monooxygenase (N-oxide forming)
VARELGPPPPRWPVPARRLLEGIPIVSATGYRVDLPFLAPSLLAARGRELPLYRRIVPPGLGGRLRLPDAAAMWRAIDRGERRSRQRFPDEHPHSIRCDPNAYRRLLRSDLRRAPAPRPTAAPLRAPCPRGAARP